MNTQTLAISPMTIMGRHGTTERERAREQRFVVTVSFTQSVVRGVATDNLRDVVDYLAVKTVVERVIAGPSVQLLETLTWTVAQAILKSFPVWDVEVTITKPDIIEIGVPKATVRLDFGEREGILDFDMPSLIRELALSGGVSIPILSDVLRRELVDEFKTLPFKRMPEQVSGGLVREDIWSSDAIAEHPKALWFRDLFTRIFQYKLMRSGLAEIVRQPLSFTELSLQFYEKGSFGITPHRDGKSIKNLIFVFILEGRAEFALCSDRAGNNPVFLDATPGSMIVLAAPGFLGIEMQPFHFVRNISSDRYVFGLRQKG